MPESALKTAINTAVKEAMKALDKQRLNALRLITAAIKQQEVDTRTELNDEQVISILNKLLKQRRDAASQYKAAGRDELAAQEEFEIQLIQGYLPAQLGTTEIAKLVQTAIQQAQAQSLQDMGKVMAILKPQLQGRADLATVSEMIKTQLGSNVN